MVFLDTDHMSLLDRGGPEGVRIRLRLRGLAPDDMATTIIYYEEQTRGWLSRIAQSPDLERQRVAYRELKRQLMNNCAIAVVDFDERASEEFERLRLASIRIGTMDLKIAAIAIANGATLLTRNQTDFGKVPGLQIADWSVE